MSKKFIPIVAGKAHEDVEQEFRTAQGFGNILLGTRHLFLKGILQVKYIPYEDIAWGYLRQEEIKIATCCRRTTMPCNYFMVVATTGESVKFYMEKEDHVREALPMMRERNPAIVTGYNQENAERFHIVTA